MNSPLPVGNWNEPAMNSPLPAPVPAQRRNWTRRVVNLLVALVVVAVAAAAFIFSYDGVHAIALFGGVSSQLARYYPGLFDAVLVIACVAAVMLRDGRWWARLWAWIVVFVVLAAIGTTDVLHAMNYALPRRPTEGIVAAAPVVAVLLAFSLLLTLLRQTRTHAEEQAAPAPLDVPALPAATAAPPIALPAAPAAASAPAPARALPGPQDAAPADLAPTRDYPALAEAGKVPQPARPTPASNEAVVPAVPTSEVPTSEVPVPVVPVPGVPASQVPTGKESDWEVPAWEVPTREMPAGKNPVAEETPERDEPTPAPPTVRVPALSPEPEPEPAEAAPTRGPQGIRYAGGGVPRAAGKQPAERDESPDEDYWRKEEEGQLAGLVYPARDDHPETGNDASDSDDAADTETGEPAARKAPPELDDDAPPFATAPFAPVPRLNRVRSMPVPPAEDDEQPGA
jgi:hypothetical protein